MKTNITSVETIKRTEEVDVSAEINRESPPPCSLPSVAVGRLVAIVPDSGPLIDFPDNRSGELLPARALTSVNEAEIGSQVALVFEDGDASKPIILGVLKDGQRAHKPSPESQTDAVEVRSDQEHLTLTASREISLVCGKASVTLTSAGKILLRGAYLLSRSSGVNRIKGGSVQIN